MFFFYSFIQEIFNGFYYQASGIAHECYILIKRENNRLIDTAAMQSSEGLIMAWAAALECAQGRHDLQQSSGNLR